MPPGIAEAYTEFIRSNGETDSARFLLGLLGSKEVIIAAGNYKKNRMAKSNEEVQHKADIDLFHAIRKDCIPWVSNLPLDQSEHLEWLMTPNYMLKKLQGGTKIN